MSPSNIPAQTIFLTVFIIPISFFPFQNLVAADKAMLQAVCSAGITDFNTTLCLETLGSDSRIASAKNYFDMSIAIIEGAISNVTTTLRRLSGLETKPLPPTLEVCKNSYDAVLVSLRSALSEVRSPDYRYATYDLMLAGTDNIRRCIDAARKEKRTDEVVRSGNAAVVVYALSGCTAVRLAFKDKLV